MPYQTQKHPKKRAFLGRYLKLVRKAQRLQDELMRWREIASDPLGAQVLDPTPGAPGMNRASKQEKVIIKLETLEEAIARCEEEAVSVLLRIYDAVESLTEIEREVILGIYVDGLDLQTIATGLDISYFTTTHAHAQGLEKIEI